MSRIVSVFNLCLMMGVSGCVADSDTSTALDPERVSIRSRFAVEAGETTLDSLYPMFPNPFSRDNGDDSITIGFSLSDTSRAIVLIQNPLGEEVVRFEDDTLSPGQYRAGWQPLSSEGEPLNAGLYFVTFRAGNYISSRMLSIQTN